MCFCWFWGLQACAVLCTLEASLHKLDMQATQEWPGVPCCPTARPVQVGSNCRVPEVAADTHRTHGLAAANTRCLQRDRRGKGITGQPLARGPLRPKPRCITTPHFDTPCATTDTQHSLVAKERSQLLRLLKWSSLITLGSKQPRADPGQTCPCRRAPTRHRLTGACGVETPRSPGGSGCGGMAHPCISQV